jgi:hypothetical protein
MKKASVVLIWVVLSLVVQTGVLVYLNDYYLKEDSVVTYTQEKPKEVPVKEEIKINIPVNASNVKLSPSAKYTYYLLDDILHVVNLTDGKDNIVELSYSIKNYFFKWHDYEDKLIITEKTPDSSNGNAIKMYTYKAKDNLKLAALDYNNESRSYQLGTQNVVVSDVQLNNLNTIMYIKASSENGTSYINRLDISGGMDKLSLRSDNVGKFFVLKKDDELVFEDLTNDKVLFTNKSKIEEPNILKDKKARLIQVDKNDNMYLGEIEEGMIKNIVYDNESNSEWSTVQLPHLVDCNDIYLFSVDEIYVVDRIKNVVTNIKSNKEISIKGKFIDMNLNGILSMNNENATITKVKK